MTCDLDLITWPRVYQDKPARQVPRSEVISTKSCCLYILAHQTHSTNCSSRTTKAVGKQSSLLISHACSISVILKPPLSLPLLTTTGRLKQLKKPLVPCSTAQFGAEVTTCHFDADHLAANISIGTHENQQLGSPVA